MDNLQNFEITRVMLAGGGIFICAKYINWVYEYYFFEDSGGRILGKTGSGNWISVSKELAETIKEKLREVLVKDDERISSGP